MTRARFSDAAPAAGRISVTLGAIVVAASLVACTHRVQVEAPEKPIVINLNVKIEQEVRVKIDRQLDDLIEENSNLF